MLVVHQKSKTTTQTELSQRSNGSSKKDHIVLYYFNNFTNGKNFSYLPKRYNFHSCKKLGVIFLFSYFQLIISFFYLIVFQYYSCVINRFSFDSFSTCVLSEVFPSSTFHLLNYLLYHTGVFRKRKHQLNQFPSVSASKKCK